MTIRSLQPILASTTIVVCIAAYSCSDSTSERVAEIVSEDPLPAGTAVRFAGVVELDGDLARADRGTVYVGVHVVGGDEHGAGAVLERSYEVEDPLWYTSDGRRALHFALDARDAHPYGSSDVAAHMDVVVRYDPDGNPETDEPGVVEARQRVSTGSEDVSIRLGRDPGHSGEAAAARGAGASHRAPRGPAEADPQAVDAGRHSESRDP